ncbi:MAG: hypothetical protein ACSHYC_05875 [Alphaproteobacteria bacterium]
MDDTRTKKPKKPDAWPNKVGNRDELDAALEAGLDSGVSERTTEEIFEAAIARVKNGRL